jgi:hypothetical protein
MDDDEEVVDQKARLMQINCNKKNKAFNTKNNLCKPVIKNGQVKF